MSVICLGSSSSMPNLTMAWVWPPHTSMSDQGLVVMRAISRAYSCAASESRYSSRSFMGTVGGARLCRGKHGVLWFRHLSYTSGLCPAYFPSPLPSPGGRWKIFASRSAKRKSSGLRGRAGGGPLSPRERARVRGKRALALRPVLGVGSMSSYHVQGCMTLCHSSLQARGFAGGRCHCGRKARAGRREACATIFQVAQLLHLSQILEDLVGLRL